MVFTVKYWLTFVFRLISKTNLHINKYICVPLYNGLNMCVCHRNTTQEYFVQPCTKTERELFYAPYVLRLHHSFEITTNILMKFMLNNNDELSKSKLILLYLTSVFSKQIPETNRPYTVQTSEHITTLNFVHG